MTDEELRLHLESLHANIAELTETTQKWVEQTIRLDRRERKGREALLSGIAAYLRALGNGEDEPETNG
ncbi:MAG TPA: hypothetical protein VKB88_21440 [Bryobacteraceae bacterium]|nr:hypothetical protein [Bryobacteraceae bacterium]